MRIIFLFIFLFLLVGCTTEHLKTPSKLLHEQAGVKTLSIREEVLEVDKIVEKAIKDDDTSGLPAVKPHTDQVRTDSVEIDSLILDLVNTCAMWQERALKAEEKLAENNKWIHWFYMFTPLGIGIVSIIIGRLTEDPKDTIFGAVAIVAGLIIKENIEVIGKWGLYSVVIAVIFWIIFQHEKRSAKNKLEEIREGDKI